MIKPFGHFFLFKKPIPLLGSVIPLLGSVAPLLGSITPLLGSNVPLLGSKTDSLKEIAHKLGRVYRACNKEQVECRRKSSFI